MRIEVEGMSCSGCVTSVERAVERVPGVVKARAELASARVDVEGEVEREAVVQAIEAAGFTAR